MCRVPRQVTANMAMNLDVAVNVDVKVKATASAKGDLVVHAVSMDVA